MKILRIILILFALLALLVIGIGLFGPTGMDISYTQKLDAPVSSVYGHVHDFKKWENWSPWAEADPNMEITYGEKTAGEGGSYSWSSKASGTGEMQINEAKVNEMLGMDIGFDMGDGMQYSSCNMEFKEMGEKTEVTWHFNNSGNDGFKDRIFNVIMPSMLTSMYEKGLTNLEREAKDHPMTAIKKNVQKPLEMGIVEKELEGFFYVGKRHDDINMTEQAADLQGMFGASFAQIGSFLGAAGDGDKLLNPPLAITHSYDRETTISSFSPAMKVTEKVSVSPDLQCEYLKPHKAMVYNHVGSYDTLSDSYKKIVEVIMAKGLTMQFPSYEIYESDPGTEPDESKWITQIVIPIEWLD